MGVPFVDGCIWSQWMRLTVRVHLRGLQTDGTHFDHEACPVYAKVVGDFNESTPYSILLKPSTASMITITSSSLDFINTHAFVDSQQGGPKARSKHNPKQHSPNSIQLVRRMALWQKDSGSTWRGLAPGIRTVMPHLRGTLCKRVTRFYPSCV